MLLSFLIWGSIISLSIIAGIAFSMRPVRVSVDPVFAFACDTCDSTFTFDNEIDGYEWFIGHLSRHGIIVTPECSPIE